jgi:hypothetical protein
MKAAIVGSLIALTAMSAHADDEWIRVASAKNASWHLRSGSGTLTKESGGAKFLAIERQSIDQRAYYGIAAVAVSDCLNGYGRLYNFDLRGKPMYANDFVTGGTSVTDARASAYCRIAFAMQSRDL